MIIVIVQYTPQWLSLEVGNDWEVRTAMRASYAIPPWGLQDKLHFERVGL